MYDCWNDQLNCWNEIDKDFKAVLCPIQSKIRIIFKTIHFILFKRNHLYRMNSIHFEINKNPLLNFVQLPFESFIKALIRIYFHAAVFDGLLVIIVIEFHVTIASVGFLYGQFLWRRQQTYKIIKKSYNFDIKLFHSA